MADILQTMFEMNYNDTKKFMFIFNFTNPVFFKAQRVKVVTGK